MDSHLDLRRFLAPCLLALTLAACSDGTDGNGTPIITPTVPPPTTDVTDVVITVQPTDIPSGATFNPEIVVELHDENGLLTSADDVVTLELLNNPIGAQLLGTTQVPAVGGIARFPGLSMTKAGQGYSLLASTSVVNTGESDTFDVTATTPVVIAPARFVDQVQDGVMGTGDLVTLRFDQPIGVQGATVADLTLPVAGDSFGTGATIQAGPRADELTITLGAGANLKLRKEFDGAAVANGASSGIDVSAGLTPGSIFGSPSCVDAAPSTPVDLMADYKATLRSFGRMHVLSVASTDLDCDGDVDFFLGRGDGIPSVVWRSTISPEGSFGFFPVRVPVTTEDAAASVFGDLDGDGRDDLILGHGQLGHGTTLANRVLFNESGSPNCTSPSGVCMRDSGQALSARDTRGLALGDVDGDGDLDLAVANYGADFNLIWMNQGDGTFVEGQVLSTGDGSSILWVDLDGDGDLDLVEGFDSQETSVTWMNDGTGALTPFQTLGLTSTRALVAADLDRDGDQDLVEANDGDTLVWINDGSGVLTQGAVLSGLGGSRAMALLDSDDDGDLDVLLGYGDDDRSGLWLNDGAANFSDSRLEIGDPGAWSFALGDFDSDGDEDILTGTGPGSANRVLFSSGSVGFGAPSFPQASSFGPSALTLASISGDFDGNGTLDLAQGFDTEFRVFSGDGAGNFTDSGVPQLTPGGTRDFAAGDVDRDGDLDIVQVGLQMNQLWLNDGQGGFTASSQIFGGSRTTSVLLEDFDGDQDLDMILGRDGTVVGAANQIWFNDGTGTFTQGAQAFIVTRTLDLVALDVECDGDLDFVDCRSDGSNLWKNNGSGLFNLTTQALPGARAAAAADLDFDGDMDLVIGGDDNTQVPPLPDEYAILLNDGSGDFSTQGGTLTYSGISTSIDLGDLDADGTMDALVGSGTAASQAWLIDRTGNATLLQALSGGNTTSARLLDVDHDGDLDAVFSIAGGSDEVWLNP